MKSVVMDQWYSIEHQFRGKGAWSPSVLQADKYITRKEGRKALKEAKKTNPAGKYRLVKTTVLTRTKVVR